MCSPTTMSSHIIHSKQNLQSKVAELNNNATQHMQVCEFAQAIVILSHALLSLKQMKSSNNKEDSTTSKDGSDIPSQDTCKYTHLLRTFEFVSLNSPAGRSDGETSVGSSWRLYDEAVEILPERAMMSKEGIIDDLSFAILYNLALCHHLDALMRANPGASVPSESSTKKITQLQRAIIFYTQAQQVLATSKAGNNKKPTLAVSGNIRHANLSLEHEEKQNRPAFLERLMSMMCKKPQGKDNGKRASFISH